MALLPLPVLHGLGAVLGWAAFGLSPTYRRRFLNNAAQAGYSFAQVRAAVSESGKLVAEAPRLWFGRPTRIEWQGSELIDAARAQGRGVLFLTPHLGCFEATAQDYAARFGPVTVLYRPARKPWLREVMDTARTRTNLTATPTTLSGVRQMLKALRAGEAVGLLPDQVPPEGLGVWAPFFGKPAYTMTLAARLAQQTGAEILLLWGERLPWGAGYLVHVSKLTQPLPNASEAESAAAVINGAMEELIKQSPGQYLWGYHRYKTPRSLAGAQDG